MASVSMIEGIAKKFINMVPRPFYTEAAQKLVHEICETIYKDLDEEKIPRKEIIQIVENFITAHLQNTDTETPSGIRKAIEDNLAKTTLEVYKDEKINMLLLQKILSEEIGTDGVFYKSLEQSINITNDPTNTPIMQNSNTGTGSDAGTGTGTGTDSGTGTGTDSGTAAGTDSGTGAGTDSGTGAGTGTDNKNDDSKDKKKVPNKDSETFAKKVVNELVNDNVQTPDIKGGDKMIGGEKFNPINHLGTAAAATLAAAVAYGALTGNDGKNKKKTNSNGSKTNLLKSSGMLKGNGMPTIPGININDKDLNAITTFADKAGKVIEKGTELKNNYDKWKSEQPTDKSNGTDDNSGHGDGGDGANVINLERGEHSNIQMQHDTKGVLPYIQTNCNGSGLGMPKFGLPSLGMPDMNFNIIKPILDSIRQPVAEELVKKIQERLSDKTTDSLTVKRDIYEKILLVIQAHLQSKEGKDMLLGHINELIKKEVDILTTNDEIKKRLLKVIFKDKNSEIYKKLIEIIADHSSPIGVAEPLPTADDATSTSPPDATSTSQPAATSTSPPADAELKPVQNGGKESKPFQVNTIEIVIQEFSKWLNEKIGHTQQPVNETPVVAEPIVGSSAEPVETKAEVIEPSTPPLADVVMVNSAKNVDTKDTSISTSVEAEPVTSNNDNPAENVGTENGDKIVDNLQDAQVTNKTNANDTSVNENTNNKDSPLINVEEHGNNQKLSTITGTTVSKSPIVSSTILPPINSKQGPSKGGNPTKNKTKKRRTKNNKRKTSKTLKNKQKRRVTKKKNRKHNHKK